jgi:hypothetical protein
MHQNPPLEADRHLANQKISNHLKRLKIHYHAHKGSQLNQMNSVHILTLCF